jgi:hypothetical protein
LVARQLVEHDEVGVGAGLEELPELDGEEQVD